MTIYQILDTTFLNLLLLLKFELVKNWWQYKILNWHCSHSHSIRDTRNGVNEAEGISKVFIFSTSVHNKQDIYIFLYIYISCSHITVFLWANRRCRGTIIPQSTQNDLLLPQLVRGSDKGNECRQSRRQVVSLPNLHTSNNTTCHTCMATMNI